MRELALWGALAACAAPPVEERAPFQQLAGEAFGTTWHVTWRGPSEADAELAITSTLERVDARMSSWREDSELSAVRRSSGPVVVSEETGAVLREALDLADATGGAFDPTVEPLMRLWGYRGARRDSVPTEAEVAEALAQVGFTRVEVFRHGGVTLVDGGGTSLDLSAIAKGYGVDAVSDALSRIGAADHLVEVGGEVRVAGQGPNGLWNLSVDAPDPSGSPGAQALTTLALTNGGVASSGNYRSAYDVDGVRVVHTMDPRTGRPGVSSVLAVTVVAPTCTTADGWATALMVLSVEEGRAAVEARPGLEALWVVEGDGAPSLVTSSGMGRVIASSRR